MSAIFQTIVIKNNTSPYYKNFKDFYEIFSNESLIIDLSQYIDD
jgi:hypothetical protein